MTQRIVVYDTSTGQTIASTTPIGAVGGQFVDFEYTVATTETTFTVTGLETSSKIDVWVNGRGPLQEGASNDFTRDAGADTITLNFPTIAGYYVRIRLYP